MGEKKIYISELKAIAEETFTISDILMEMHLAHDKKKNLYF